VFGRGANRFTNSEEALRAVSKDRNRQDARCPCFETAAAQPQRGGYLVRLRPMAAFDEIDVENIIDIRARIL